MARLAAISLGSSVGDRRQSIQSACDALAESPGITNLQTSSLYETVAVGGPSGQPSFGNAATVFETSLGPEALLAVVQALERAASRRRTTHWGPRSLDLDLLLYGEVRIRTRDLMIPHPRMCTRAFVLAPLAELAPGLVEPYSRLTIAELATRIQDGPRRVSCPGFRPELRKALRARLPSHWEVVDHMPSAPEPLPLFQALDVSLWDDSTRRDPQIPTVWIEPDLPVEEVDQVVAACLAADDTPQRVARLNPGPS